MWRAPEHPQQGDIVQYAFRQDIRLSSAWGLVIGTDSDSRVLVMWHTRKGLILFELHEPATLRAIVAARCHADVCVTVKGGFFVAKR